MREHSNIKSESWRKELRKLVLVLEVKQVEQGCKVPRFEKDLLRKSLAEFISCKITERIRGGETLTVKLVQSVKELFMGVDMDDGQKVQVMGAEGDI